MNIQAVKIDLVQKLLSVKNELLLKKINSLLDKEAVVAFSVEGKPLTREQYDKNLADAEKEIEAGYFISQEDLESKSAKWKTKK